MQISVDGVNAKYCSVGMHLYYDRRLQIETDPFGDPLIKKGGGIEYLGTIKIQADPTASDFDNDTTKWNGVFFATTGSANKGLDGVLYEMNFTIPVDAKPGDVYPIDIVYRPTTHRQE